MRLCRVIAYLHAQCTHFAKLGEICYDLLLYVGKIV